MAALHGWLGRRVSEGRNLGVSNVVEPPGTVGLPDFLSREKIGMVSESRINRHSVQCEAE